MAGQKDHLRIHSGRRAWAACGTTGYAIRLVSMDALDVSKNPCRRCLGWVPGRNRLLPRRAARPAPETEAR